MLRNKKRGTMRAFGVLTTLCCLMYGMAYAQGPNPNEVYLHSVTYGGTGCPNGSVAQSFSNDRTSSILIFDQYLASSGSGVPIQEARKNCQLNLNLHVPPGAGNTVVTMEFRGYVQLTAGVAAQRTAIYYKSGEVEQVADGDTFDGPIATDYLGLDDIPLHLNKTAVDGCITVIPVNANTQIRILAPPNTDAQITLDSIDVTIHNTGAPRGSAGPPCG